MALSSIGSYLAIQTHNDQDLQQDSQLAMDPAKLTYQLKDLLNALDSNNHDDVKLMLTNLQHELGRDSVHLIVEAVDEFDFNLARIETRKMLENIGA